jgi:hypothetical protein
MKCTYSVIKMAPYMGEIVSLFTKRFLFGHHDNNLCSLFFKKKNTFQYPNKKKNTISRYIWRLFNHSVYQKYEPLSL